MGNTLWVRDLDTTNAGENLCLALYVYVPRTWVSTPWPEQLNGDQSGPIWNSHWMDWNSKDANHDWIMFLAFFRLYFLIYLRKSRKRQPELEPAGAAQAHYSSQVFPRVRCQTGASANWRESGGKKWWKVK